ncbi:AraC family transcriptional regulator [Bacteroides sp. 224]|uniref:helix-turn-helix transcriptional regulator n=1 Tax=Bacteroides sp. 224 TaxID=2302936 RepID=UPI0013D71D13|nr:AraC family transcriptional regulator [Bacteroides sp. 224]NDV64105.1 AraC family transcriptional regulator [Bacteroides sp. 224]
MGNTPDNLSLLLLNVGFTEMNANWNWKDVYSPFARLYYIKEGEAKTLIGNRTIILKPNHLYLTPPFTLHHNECNGYFSHYYIHFYEKVLNRESIFDKYEFPFELEASNLDLLLSQRLLDINPDRHLQQLDPTLYDNIPTFSQLIADNNKLPMHTGIETRAILQQFMAKFFEFAKIKTRHKDERITKCLKFIHENTDKDISVGQLAGLVYITEDHLIRIFKKEMNTTPLRYINAKKMEKAQLLLLTTDMSIREIAFDLSIDNISYFNRIFKSYTNSTPTEYRRSFNVPQKRN